MDIYEIILLTLVASFIISLAQLSFKRSIKRIDAPGQLFALAANKGFMAGLLAYLIGLGLYLKALSGADLSLVYPLFASTFIFVAILSAVMLKEKLNAKRIAGIVLIFIGIAVVALAA